VTDQVIDIYEHEISPQPTTEELQAIIKGVNLAWPKPLQPIKQSHIAWRFANRWWLKAKSTH
jgi:hypothetical protein